MNKKMAKLLGVLLLALAVAVTQVPVSDAEAVEPASDFQMEGSKLLKYVGTAEAVSIPDGVKEIGEEAFAGNDNLVKVTIGGRVEKVGYRAFADCRNLRTISMGDTVAEVETAAFSNNPELRNVTIGTGLKKVGSGAFAGCGSLSRLSVDDDNPYLSYSDGVLYDDEKKILFAMMPDCPREAITLPESLERINAYAFWGNPHLRHVTFDSKIENIPDYAFSNCLNLESVTIPLPVRSIGAKAFEDCVNLTLVTLPDSISTIHSTAFDGCFRVEFEATPGTYGAEYAAGHKASEADRIEYEDVQDSQVISSDQITDDITSPQETPLPEQTPQPQETPQETPGPQDSSMPPESPTTIEGSAGTGRLLGESSIVAGRAVVFIDNGQQNVMNGEGERPKIDLGGGDSATAGEAENTESKKPDLMTTIGDILSDQAAKGEDFPKYTVVGDKIATQAYYQNADLTEYEIDDAVTQIGDFAFARSGLGSIVIPDGVEKIGYGAFYHCENLNHVTIPESVKEIEGNAFVKTPWLEGQADTPFLVAGDGILLSYFGKDSVVNVPDGVKQIGAEVFKDHMGITAVNLPDSVTVIGEAAFSGCKNLKTVNGGKNLVKIEDRAFFECPLSKVVVPASVEEIGLGAYALTGGTDTVVFEGEKLPVLSVGERAKRLSNEAARTYVFGDCKEAIVPDSVTQLDGTVLDESVMGFHGIVYNEAGALVQDAASTEGQESEDGGTAGIEVRIDSQAIASEGAGIMADLPGNTGSFLLQISDSQEAAERIALSYGEIYGGREPSHLVGLDITLLEKAGRIPITMLGKQYVTVQIPMPSELGSEGLHVVTLDEDDQLEAVKYQIVNLEDGDYIQFTARHFSPYGIYQYSSGINGQGVVQNGSAYITMGSRDDTPDTGDGVHPKWFLAAGLCAMAVALFFYKGKRKT